MDQIALILVDEIHSIGETRGGCLEGLITNSQMMRLKKTCITEKESPASCLRILALSATVTNIEDLAQWLHAKAFVYGNEARAVPLEILVNSYIQKSSDYLFDNSLSYKIYDLISALSLGRPTIVFCSSRKGCFTAANILLEEIKRKGNIIPSDSFQRENLMRASVNIQEKNLKKIILHGIGIHSAALCYRDREIIVNLFRSNSIRVLYCTTTLAQGVNLPAHLVVIKG